MTIYYMCSSHWDREWYLPFQGFRYELVKMIDDMIEKLESDPEFSLFTMDGQTVLLEDYQEIAGSRIEKLKKLIDAGRIKIGPWYTMPDELLVSGESLIRNLMEGFAVSKRFGTEAWKYGYVNDVFGHIAQMPQIFSGFGIEGAYLGRGLGNDKKMSHFIWKSPDGSKCYAYLGHYSGFSRDCVISNYETEKFETSLKEYIDCEISKSEVPIILIMHTADHAYADGRVSSIKKKIAELYPMYEIKHVSLEEMVKHVAEYETCMPTVQGELIRNCQLPVNMSNGGMVLVANSISSYYTIKQNNDRCQNLLEKVLEPLLVFSDILNKKTEHSFLDLAYRYLLKNQAHDSICGCSVDNTHEDMFYRYAQIYNIANAIKYDFENHDSSSGDEYKLKVYHLEPYCERKAITVKLDFSGEFQKEIDRFSANESADCFELIGFDGRKIPYQIIKTEFDCFKRTVKQSGVRVRRYTVSFIDDLPAMGISEYRVVPAKPRVIYKSGCISGDDYIENKYIRLDITPFGELELYDKRTQKTYRNLNRFLDNGENGDGWWHMPPKNDVIVNSKSSPCIIEKVSDGAVSTTFKITKTLSVPADFDEIKHTRSEKRVNITIACYVTVTVDSPVVKIEATVDNCAKDHRLRLMLPTGIYSDSYFAGQAFFKVLRSTELSSQNDTVFEREMAEKNMNGIIGIKDDNGDGLAFVSNEGLHEGTVNEKGEIYITLLRSFHKVFLQPDAVRSQIQQKLEYKYSIVPLNSETDYADLLRIQNNLNDTIITDFSRTCCNGIKKPISFMSIDNNNVVPSVVKLSQDGSGYIIRFLCVSEQIEKINIMFGIPIKKALLTNLNEEVLEEITMNNTGITLDISPWKIVTIKVIK